MDIRSRAMEVRFGALPEPGAQLVTVGTSAYNNYEPKLVRSRVLGHTSRNNYGLDCVVAIVEPQDATVGNAGLRTEAYALTSGASGSITIDGTGRAYTLYGVTDETEGEDASASSRRSRT